MEKYIVYLDCCTEYGETPVIGIKYDAIKKKLSIGGYKRFRRPILNVLRTFFSLELSDRCVSETRPQANKIRFDVVLGSRKVYPALDEMEKAGIQMKLVKSLERIMR